MRPHTASLSQTKLNPPLLSWAWAKRPFSKGLQVQLGSFDSLPSGCKCGWEKARAGKLRGTTGAPRREEKTLLQRPSFPFEQNTSLQHKLFPSFSFAPNKEKRIREAVLLDVPNSKSKLQHQDQHLIGESHTLGGAWMSQRASTHSSPISPTTLVVFHDQDAQYCLNLLGILSKLQIS